MIHTIRVNPRTVEKKILMFKEINLDELPNPQIVPLFGANGSGKTTLLNGIEDTVHAMSYEEIRKKREEMDRTDILIESLKGKAPKKGNYCFELDMDKEPTMLLAYRNSKDNFRNKEAGSYFESFDLNYISQKLTAQALSEGQSIVYSGFGLFDTIQEELFSENPKNLIVLIDELDSGLSIDNLIHAYSRIEVLAHTSSNVQFFISFNNPFILRYFHECISMYTGKVIRLESMDQMIRELQKGSKKLDRRRKDADGNYKIFDN